MTKRSKFVITSLLLSLGFVTVSFLDGAPRFWGIGFLSFFTIALTFWSLFDTLNFDATLLVLILPAFYTLGVGLFWFLLPSTFLARLPVVFLYGIGMYSLCLTMNIFSVSTIRTIALSRAAKGVGFVLTLFTSFLLFDSVISLKINPIIVSLLVFIISFLLFLQGLWFSKLERQVSKEMFLYSSVFSYFLAVLSAFLFFWPVKLVVGSLFLTVAAYVLLGLGQAKIEARLFKATAREYLIVGILVFLVMFFVTSWRG